MVISSLEAKTVSFTVLTDEPISSFKSQRNEMKGSIASFASVGIGETEERIRF